MSNLLTTLRCYTLFVFNFTWTQTWETHTELDVFAQIGKQLLRHFCIILILQIQKLHVPIFYLHGLETFRSLLSKKCKWSWWCHLAVHKHPTLKAACLHVRSSSSFSLRSCLFSVQSKAENAKRGDVQELDFSWACVWVCGLPVLMLSVWLHLRRIPVKHRVPTCLWWRTQSAIWALNLSQTILTHDEKTLNFLNTPSDHF